MRSARFDATGSRVRVTFDQPVRVRGPARSLPANVECSMVFANASRLLGSGAVCELKQATTLVIALSYDATLLPSPPSEGRMEGSVSHQRACAPNMLSLLDGELRSLRDKSVGAVGCVGVAAPSNPKRPVAVTVYQRRIGVCDDLVIDAARSVAASGGRRLVFNWAVTFANGTETISSPVTAAVLGHAASVTVTTAMMPNAATAIAVNLTLESIFGVQSLTVMRVVWRLDQLPSVELSALASVARHNAFVVSASGSVPPCANGTSAPRPTLTYSWQLHSAPMPTDTDSGDSEKQTWTVLSLRELLDQNLVSYTNTQQSGLRFIPHVLEACTAYQLRCMVGYTAAGGVVSKSNWRTHSLVVPQGKIVALISGELKAQRSVAGEVVDGPLCIKKRNNNTAHQHHNILLLTCVDPWMFSGFNECTRHGPGGDHWLSPRVERGRVL